MNFFYVKQFPVLPPDAYTAEDLRFIVPRALELVYTAWDLQPFVQDVWNEADESLRAVIGPHPPSPSPKALGEGEQGGEGFPFPPFHWDESRRAILRAELDAYYARLYGLTRKQLRYILDPADLTERELEDILDPWEEVSDPLDPAGYAERCAKSDFPGETFRVLKEKEIRQYGEYRTRRLVLEAWERLEGNGEWRVADRKNPPAAVAHPVAGQSPLAADQPPPADFGLYKCGACGKMVMGFDRESHIHEAHKGKTMEWRRVR